MGSRQWLILLLLGLILAVAALPARSADNADPASGSFWGEEEEETGESGKTELERRLEKILSSMKGVGKVEVLLMTEEESTAFSGSEKTEVTGVLIVAEGADDPVTAADIVDAVMALFQIEAHRIRVMKMI
ncbi:MAG: hypothetical protein LUG62_08120 [Clostridiales bacterium]|nr:hypothetical protein [Clostridiales bacterium]